MEKTTARLIVTLDCNRDCPLCCNKQPGLLDSAEVIPDLHPLRKFKEVVITGGEPLLHVNKVLPILYAFQHWGIPTYLYTSMWHPKLQEMSPLLSGVTYSVHKPFVGKAQYDFLMITRLTWNSGASWRLHVDSDLTSSIAIQPFPWSRITFGSMKEVCPLPEHEKLFILEEANNGRLQNS